MAIAFVQSNAAGFNNGSAAQSVAFSSNVTAGNILIIAVSVFSGSAVSAKFVTVTDNAGNVYRPINLQVNLGGSLQVYCYYAIATTTGPCTVTCTPASTTYFGIGVHEYSGVSAISPIDGSYSSEANTAVTTTSAGLPIVQRAGETVFAAISQPAGTIACTAGAGFTRRANLTNSTTAIALITEDQIGLSSTVSAAFTFASSCNTVGVAFVMRPAYTPTSPVKAVPGQASTFQYLSPTTSTYVTTPLVCTYPNPTTSGNLLICCVSIQNNSGASLLTAVTDNKGNTWSLVTFASASSSFNTRVEIWQCPNAIGGANHVVTITPVASVYLSAVLNEYTGSVGITAFTNNASGTTTVADTGSFSSSTNSLTIAVMGQPSLLGSSGANRNTIALTGSPTSTWTNVGTSPASAQLSAGIGVQSFGDNTADPGSTLDATWTFVDSQFWVTTAVVILAATPSETMCMGEDSMILDPNTAFVREFAIGTTGLTVNIQLSKAGGALANPSAGAGNLTEIGRGLYKYALTATDTNTLGSLGYALTDAATNLTIYGHVVDRVVSIPAQVFGDTVTTDFQVANSFGAMLQIGGVIVNTTDLTPLPNMSEPTHRPAMTDPLIDGISWICMTCVTQRDETDILQRVWNIANDTVIASAPMQLGSGIFVHGNFN